MGAEQSLTSLLSADCEGLAEAAKRRRRKSFPALTDCCSALDGPETHARRTACPNHLSSYALPRCTRSSPCDARGREISDDDPKLFPGGSPRRQPCQRKRRDSDVVSCGMPHSSDTESETADEWRRCLEHGAAVSLDGEPVILSLDSWSLRVRGRDSLYHLAELRGCEELPRAYGGQADAFELVVSFSDLEPLVFQFDEEEFRTAFAQVMDQLALEAKHSAPQVVVGASPGSGYFVGSDSENEESSDFRALEDVTV